MNKEKLRTEEVVLALGSFSIYLSLNLLFLILMFVWNKFLKKYRGPFRFNKRSPIRARVANLKVQTTG